MNIPATDLAVDTELPENKLVAELCENLRHYLEQSQIEDVVRAFEYARKAHQEQFRKSGEPYIINK